MSDEKYQGPRRHPGWLFVGAPWKADQHLGCKDIRGNKFHDYRQSQYSTEIVTTPGYGGVGGEVTDAATARLIAAAPELLERLDSLISYVGCVGDTGCSKADPCQPCEHRKYIDSLRLRHKAVSR